MEQNSSHDYNEHISVKSDCTVILKMNELAERIEQYDKLAESYKSTSDTKWCLNPNSIPMMFYCVKAEIARRRLSKFTDTMR